MDNNGGAAAAAADIVFLENRLDGTDVEYYNNAAKYWESVDGTVNGMLGGFGKVSEPDIDGSNKLLKALFKVLAFILIFAGSSYTRTLTTSRWITGQATRER
jgi:hypothetical protein